MPTGRINNDLATAKVRGITPTARVGYSQVLVPGFDTTVQAGTPMGLLLALTYPITEVIKQTLTVFKGEVPTARIRNDS